MQKLIIIAVICCIITFVIGATATDNTSTETTDEKICCRAFYGDIHTDDDQAWSHDPDEFDTLINGLILLGDMLHYFLQDCKCPSPSL